MPTRDQTMTAGLSLYIPVHAVVVVCCLMADAAAAKGAPPEEVMRKYPTRLIASDPATWRPVTNQVAVPVGGVTLDDAGLFKPAMSNNIAYLLKSFSVDHMLVPFRQRAGKPVPPEDFPQEGFWENKLRGSCAGRFLMGAGNTLRWMEHPELRRKLDDLIDGIEACRAPNGYILAYPPDNPVCEEPNYARAWFTHGLIEAGIAGNPKAFGLLRGHADWFNKWELLPKLLYFSSNNPQGQIASTRTYFSPVGKPEDLQVSEKYYVCDWWMDQLAARDPAAIWKYPLDHPHCYLITSFEAYLDHYRATGDRKYLDAMLGAWDLIHDNWEHVGGSMAICEGKPYPPGSYYLAKQCTGETCGSVFWIKFNQRLHQLFPMEEKYVNEIEKSLYNVGLANQYPNGQIRYHARLEGPKDDHGFCNPSFNTCCAGQGTRLMGSLPEYIYSIATDGLFVNLYEPSAIRWQKDGRSLDLTMKSSFPFQPGIEIEISAPQAVAMKLRVRVPSWATKEMPISVNGKQAATGKPGTYVVLDRTWTNGDTIAFTLPMDFRVTRYTGVEQFDGHERYALEYGPILMAVDGLQGNPFPCRIFHNPAKPQEWLTPRPDKPLQFTIDGDSEHSIMPYWLTKGWVCTVFPVIDRLSVQGRELFLKSTPVKIVSYLPAEADIRYTVDGSEPAPTSPQYKEPFLLERSTTVKARAFSGGQPLLPSTAGTFQKVPLFPPTIRPALDGKKIEILASPAFPEAELYYTLDGSEPTEQSTRYTAPLDMPKEKTTIRARAVVPAQASSAVLTYVVPAEENPQLPDVYLSDLKPLKYMVSGETKTVVKKDCRYGDTPLSFLGKEFKKGVGVYPPSELVYAAQSEYQRFVALATLDSPRGSVVFEVYADEQMLAQTPVLRAKQPWIFDLPIPAGTQSLRLVVSDGGDGSSYDGCSWLNAGFIVRKQQRGELQPVRPLCETHPVPVAIQSVCESHDGHVR